MSIHVQTSEPDNDDTPIDYAPMRRACAALVGWAAAVARARAPDDAEAITRAETAVRVQLTGRCSPHEGPHMRDLLAWSASLADACGVDLGQPLAPRTGDRLRGAAITLADLLAALLARLGGQARNENHG